MKKIKIGLTGCTGRMGKLIGQLTQENNDFVISQAIAHKNSSFLNQDYGKFLNLSEKNIPVISDPVYTPHTPLDVLIDFSSAAGFKHYLTWASDHAIPFVSGTTGLSEDDYELLEIHRKKIPLLYAPNMSIGINLLFNLTHQVSQILDEQYDIEIFEAHHNQKKDAPSGTALKLGEMAAKGRNYSQNKFVFHRNQMRQKGDIGYSILRGGSIIGEHAVYFAGLGENIILKHQASDRKIYAQGALVAAKWICAQPPGLYSMQNLLEKMITHV